MATSRRDFLAFSAALPIAAPLAGAVRAAQPEPGKPAASPVKGRLKQSVCRWCYGNMAIEDLCKNAAAMGIKSVELLGESEWDVPARFGLTCAIANGPTTIGNGLNRVDNHAPVEKEAERLLPLVKAANIPQMIVFSGNRNGMSDADGLKNCVEGLKRLTPMAEAVGVTLVMELLNSRVDHRDYMCDRTAWGVELVKQVASPRFKLLYDIYHMQIMEGDVIRTIMDNFDHIAHYHTAGVPGRNEIDKTQELNYSAICTALVNRGFTGYLAQEFLAVRDPMTSLKEAVQICDV